MSLVLLRPLWLLAWFPVMAAAIWLVRRGPGGGWDAVVDPDLMPALRRLGLLADGGRSWSARLPLVAAGVVAVALSGPAMMRPGAVWQALDPIILVLDLSPSVVADPRLLGDLQAAAATVLAGAEGRPVGMMVYAGDAYLASAPTRDTDTVQGLVAVLGQGTMPIAGTRPDIALSMARDLFGSTAEGGLGGADLVVISDGGGTGVRTTEEAARLANDGARIWALVLPRAAEGAPPADPAGLAAMAAAGGGSVRPVAETAALVARIAQARTARFARDPQAAGSFRDFGPWLLPMAMAALFPSFRRSR